MSRLLQDWVSAQAQRRPEATAVVMDRQTLTYGELEAWANRLARLLNSAGCERGDRVAFAIPKSPRAMVAILGILKAGCIHVPIDSASPAARVAKVLKSSAPRFLLGVNASSHLLETLISQGEAGASIGIGWLDDALPKANSILPDFSWSDGASFSAEAPAVQNTSEDPAHILFTSGSTGEPKGVVITHQNVIQFVEWAVRYLGMTGDDRLSGQPPLHFDLATFDIFGTFAAGAQLHLVSPELSLLPNKLADFMRSAELTQWFSVPSLLNYMAKFDVVQFNDFPALRRLLWCGEVLPTPALIYWMKRLPHVSFTNLYGPTETTIASSYYRVPACPADSTQPIPIGAPCDGEQLLVLDGGRKAVAAGEVGDLYIGGAGLSPGYWRDPAKTDSAFFRHDTYGRIYRTGDLARVGEDGLVYFVGRADTQIKSRGYRIELGEIEAALNTCAELKECAVVAIPSEGFQNNLICCAFVAQDAGSLQLSDLCRKLGTLLPSYMLPARWMSFEGLPKNANGKIDRRALQDRFAQDLAGQQRASASDNGSSKIAEPREAAAGVSATVPGGTRFPRAR